MRNFFASILNFALFHSLLCINNKILGEKNFDWTIMGVATIILRSLKTMRMKQIFKIGKKIFLKIIWARTLRRRRRPRGRETGGRNKGQT